MFKYKKLLLLIGGNNYNYFSDGLLAIGKFKKNVKLIILTKNISPKIQFKVRNTFKKVKIIQTSKIKLNKSEIDYLKNNCHLGINIGFNYIVSKKVLNILPILNPHPSYLPYNRGCHHSFWSIIENTPAGATLHFMNENIDGGDILFRKKIKIFSYISAQEIQERSEKLAMQLLKQHLEKILKGKFSLTKQTKFTYHSKKDILSKTILNHNDKIKVSDLFNLFRATFNKENGFFIKFNKKKFFIKIENYQKVK